MARTGRPRLHTLNIHAFAEISEETLYWAGFLMADGCVTDRGEVKLTLSTKDQSHLERFRDFLGSSHSISVATTTSSELRSRRITSTCSTLNISCRTLVQDLEKFGVVPRKTIVGRATSLVERDRHFWRGVIDGDGCIGVYDVRGYDQLKVGLTGGHGLCQQFIGYCRSLSPKIRSEVQSKPGGKASSVWIHDRHARAVLTDLYRGATVWLPRKREKIPC